jgi:hypothetical protein
LGPANTSVNLTVARSLTREGFGELRQANSNVVVRRFFQVLTDSVLEAIGGLDVDAIGKKVLGIFNQGIANIAINKLVIGSGSIVDGPGETLLINIPGDGEATFTVGDPINSSLISGTGNKHITRASIQVYKDNTSNTNGAAADFASSTVNYSQKDRQNKTCKKSDNPCRMFLLRSLQGLTNQSTNNDLKCNNPFVKVDFSTINACDVTNDNIVVYLSDIFESIVVDSDLICVRILGAGRGENLNGPIFSTYNSSSLITNGSTFELPIIIEGDYTHSKLDGIIFYIKIKGHCSKACDCKCRNESVTINLSSDCDWNGRVIKYKRIDCSHITVNIRSDSSIEQECLGEVCIRPHEAIELHNLEGNWYILSHLGVKSHGSF